MNVKDFSLFESDLEKKKMIGKQAKVSLSSRTSRIQPHCELKLMKDIDQAFDHSNQSD